MKHYQELDAFRGLSILSVVLFHYTTRYDQIYGHQDMCISFPYGYLGVQFFYMLSGFLIFMSLKHVDNMKIFITKRIVRLYPSYWVSIILTYGFVIIFTLPGREPFFIDTLINFSMLQDWLPGIQSVDGAYWTLSRFLSFYFIVFLINKFNLTPKIVLICYLWLLLICATKTATFFNIYLPYRVKLTLLLFDGSLFILGILFFLWKNDGISLDKALAFMLCLSTILFVNGEAVFISVLFFSALFILVIYGKVKFIAVRPLIWLGSISYPLYLIHQNIGYVIIRNLYTFNINFYLIIILPVIGSLLLAVIVTYYVEKPAIHFIREKL